MRVARGSASLMGAVCIAALTASAVLASEAGLEKPLPAALVEFALPALPEAAVVITASEGDEADLALPALPEASLAFTAADHLRSALAAQLSEGLAEALPRLPRKEREAIAAFYTDSGYRPLWVAEKGLTPAAKSLIQGLKAAHEDGLDPSDYPIPAVASTKSPIEDWAAVEVKLSAAAVLYARDARGGRIEPARLSGLLTPKLHLPEAGTVLRTLGAARNPGEALAAYNPQHPGYRALKAKLGELRANRPGTPMVRAPDNGLKLAAAAGTPARGKGARAADAPAVASLGLSSSRLEGDLVANMERWRWLPPELGERHIVVNIPEFRLRLFDKGEMVHTTRVVVGKPESQTPVFSDEMEHVIVNPSWTVPPSIMRKEFLPALARDPSYAARRGYEVIRSNGRISVRQPPGARNALGYVKFIFPNDHAVYLHDTPSRHLFAHEMRAFSHGCVRVQEPFKLAEAILETEGWNEQKLQGLVGKGERHIRVRRSLPVHLAYFTLAADEQGQVKAYDDLYGHHAKVRAALGLNG
jgi:murein L,D-transpeptidase YcbB/YkuD